MQWWEILIVVAIALFTVLTFVTYAIKKAKNKGGCCCDCSSCKYGSSCGGNCTQADK